MINIKQICLVLFSVMICSTFNLNAINNVDDPLTRGISVLEEAVKEKSIDKLNKCISPNFSVGVATMPSSIDFVQQIFDIANNIDSIKIISNEKTKNGSNIKVKFYFNNGESRASGIYLDDNYKIKYIDYFDEFYGMFRNKESTLVAKVPFEYVNDAIIVSIKINDFDKPLRFLFDTGADGMAITKKYADEIGLTVDRQNEASVVGASRSIPISTNDTVHLDAISLEGQNIAIFEEMGDKDGVIGLNLAKRYILKVDFKESNILLYSMGKFNPPLNAITIPITVPNGIIHIPSQLDLLGKGVIESEFVLDTGARYNLVAFNQFVRKNRLLLSGFKYSSQDSMVSMGHQTVVYNGKANMFSLGSIVINDLPITLQASSGNSEWDPGVAGSIGIKLLKDYNFTINLVDKEIYMEKL